MVKNIEVEFVHNVYSRFVPYLRDYYYFQLEFLGYPLINNWPLAMYVLGFANEFM